MPINNIFISFNWRVYILKVKDFGLANVPSSILLYFYLLNITDTHYITLHWPRPFAKKWEPFLPNVLYKMIAWARWLGKNEDINLRPNWREPHRSANRLHPWTSTWKNICASLNERNKSLNAIFEKCNAAKKNLKIKI